MKISSGMRKLVDQGCQTGRVERIVVRPVRRDPAQEVGSWTLGAGQDHGKNPKRAVTLIQSEHIETIQSIVGKTFDYSLLRRNILTSGINLMALEGRRFRVGEVILEATECCDPCARMEELLGVGGYVSMLGMGGLCAKIISEGTIHTGDEITLMATATG